MVRRSKYWLLDDKVLCITPRAASTSMCIAIEPYVNEIKLTALKQSEVLVAKNDGVEVLMWHREPLSRLASAYTVKGFGDPEAFADMILGPGDKHVDPQTEYHTINGIFLPTKVYKLDNAYTTWDWEFPNLYLSNEYHNKPSNLKYNWDQLKKLINPVKVTAIENKYSSEIAYYESLTI